MQRQRRRDLMTRQLDAEPVISRPQLMVPPDERVVDVDANSLAQSGNGIVMIDFHEAARKERTPLTVSRQRRPAGRVAQVALAAANRTHQLMNAVDGAGAGGERNNV